MHAGRRYVGIALLALYVLGGTWGLPVLDAVVYHAADGVPAGPHVEPLGGCGHADSCVLGAPTPLSSPGVGRLPVTRVLPTAPGTLPARQDTPLALSRPPTQHPRAPPLQVS